MTTVRTFAVGEQTVIEVTAAAAATLDTGWRQRWAQTARAALADFASAGPAHCSARVATGRAAPLLELADEVNEPAAAGGPPT